MEIALGVAVLDRVVAERLAQRLGHLGASGRAHCDVRLRRQARARCARPPSGGSRARRARRVSPSCASQAARNVPVAADRLAEPLARSRARGGCSGRRARRAAPPRRRAAAARSPGNRSRGTPSAGGGSRSRSAPRRAAAGRAASPSSRRSPPCRTRGRRGSRGEALEAEPRRVDLLEVLAGQPADDRPARRGDGDEALALELAQAGAHRRRRDAELLREIALDERRPRGQLAVDDQIAQRLAPRAARPTRGPRAGRSVGT